MLSTSPHHGLSSPTRKSRALETYHPAGISRAMRRRSTLYPLTFLLAAGIVYILYNHGSIKSYETASFPPSEPLPEPEAPRPKGPDTSFPSNQLPPLPPLTVAVHPIRQLVESANSELEKTLASQSKTLSEAVAEYKRRHGIAPPPHFDKWYEFATERGVVLIDEYDSILDTLKPFWALAPATIRGRAREALGFDNFLLGILVRNGRVTSHAANVKTKEKSEGSDWQAGSTVGMMKSFVQWLPDMDLPFNTHDEPRVVVPHDDLERLVRKGQERMAKIGGSDTSLRNEWSRRPEDMSYTRMAPEIRTTRFNRFAHQATWTNSRISCPPDSPARSLDEEPMDDTETYAHSELSLVQNKTAFSDICNSPSLRQTFGFFDRPNSFDIVHDLFPIFSQSKISSFQDILYPSPWYWEGKVPYKASQDKRWDDKQNKLYWRGSTTGGFSRDGGWRRQHRQQVIRNANANDMVRVFSPITDTNDESQTKWNLTEAARRDFSALFDVHFSHIGQCDPGDCTAQENFFGKVEQAPQEAAWNYKYLLDVDGNAFSGRFYAFLQSMSAVFKMAIFREWHDGDGWVRPWVHYVPLSLSGHEYVEALRYFDTEDEGKALAKQMAEAGRKWANKALRNDDLEVWFFRLLLEYGRLVDDNRDSIGFTM